MTDKEKLTRIDNALDRVKCDCKWLTVSGNRLRFSICCRICDADLIAEYGDEESTKGFIDLNKWPAEGRIKLQTKIKDFNKAFMDECTVKYENPDSV